MERDQLRDEAINTETGVWESFGFPHEQAREMAKGTIVGALALSWTAQAIRNPLATSVIREFEFEMDRVARIDDPPYHPEHEVFTPSNLEGKGV